MVRGEVRLPCFSWAGHEAIFGSDVDTRSTLQTFSRAWLLGFLSSDLSNKKLTSGPGAHSSKTCVEVLVVRERNRTPVGILGYTA